MIRVRRILFPFFAMALAAAATPSPSKADAIDDHLRVAARTAFYVGCGHSGLGYVLVDRKTAYIVEMTIGGRVVLKPATPEQVMAIADTRGWMI